MTQSEAPNDRLNRLETMLADTAELVLAHDEALTRIESAIQQLTANTAETQRLAAQNNQRIEQILEYLFRERPNGRSGEEGYFQG